MIIQNVIIPSVAMPNVIALIQKDICRLLRPLWPKLLDLVSNCPFNPLGYKKNKIYYWIFFKPAILHWGICNCNRLDPFLKLCKWEILEGYSSNFFLYLSVCLSLSLSLSMYVCVSLSNSLSLFSLCHSLRIYLSSSVFLSIFLCLFIYLPLSFYLSSSVFLSIFLCLFISLPLLLPSLNVSLFLSLRTTASSLFNNLINGNSPYVSFRQGTLSKGKCSVQVASSLR